MFKIDHVAFSVHDIDKSISFYELLGFKKKENGTRKTCL